ncbi:MAG: GNAT family N-acetyltransferase [Hyphomicrobiaceae bacterium]
MTNLAFLVGQVVTLRPLERTDIEGNYPSWFNDQDNDRFTEHGTFPTNRDDALAFYDSLRQQRNVLHLAIIESDTDQHVGNISLQRIDWISRRAEFALIIGEHSAKRKGIAYEAGKLIIRHGFDRLNLNRIYLGVNSENVAAIALFKKLGFQEEGRLRQHILRDFTSFDVINMAILRDEWARSAS